MRIFASRFALLSLALSTLALAPVAGAQDSAPGAADSSSAGPQHFAPDPQKQAARLTKRLGLNADQSAKIVAILQNHQQQAAAARGDTSLSQQDRRARLHAIQQEAASQINAVLTPEQQTQYAAMKQNMKDRWQHGHDGSSPPSGNPDDASNNGGN
ncbi:hypothetical protein ISP15_04235 [Dyella jejuensis]|uniref:Spy/CpxP family protein refolding chaperone n=1 Tax=Dyella jejuensis TaxID=1432009 RepID=A0ABW8JEW7_9GAMM